MTPIRAGSTSSRADEQVDRAHVVEDSLHRAGDILIGLKVVVLRIAKGRIVRRNDDVAARGQFGGVRLVLRFAVAGNFSFADRRGLMQRQHGRQPLAIRIGGQVQVRGHPIAIAGSKRDRLPATPPGSSISSRTEISSGGSFSRDGNGPIACCMPARMCPRRMAQSCAVFTACSVPESS